MNIFSLCVVPVLTGTLSFFANYGSIYIKILI